MAKKSNKTEHVMKLITKDTAAEAQEQAAPGGIDSIEAEVKSSGSHELNYKTKLKIEIEPEIEIKEPPRPKPAEAPAPPPAAPDAGPADSPAAPAA
ncbi:MAG: hypothetical protein LBS32_05715, partial [Clostridiales Family XIII bacterium]|nr:hypothetical protein [Clostridiales Family XIII bacterium]